MIEVVVYMSDLDDDDDDDKVMMMMIK